jgi:myo-inositol 2-dehydrogenase/D-chiro-inositol 1-dehydrogenase
MNWFVDKVPVKAMGWGGRQRRLTGDQYDFFSIEYVYDNGMQTHCAARQINGCSNLKQEIITGTKGFADCSGAIFDLKGNPVWKYQYPKEGNTDLTWKVKDPYVQEHINLVTAIRSGKTISDAEAQVNSTLITIMGRISAYTGKDVTWEEMLNSSLSLGPKSYEMGTVPGIPETVPVIGVEAKLI